MKKGEPIYIKADGSYSYIYRSKTTTFVSNPIGILEKNYPFLFRCHRSYLINPANITGIYKKNIILNFDIMVPVAGRRVPNIKKWYKDFLLTSIKNF